MTQANNNAEATRVPKVCVKKTTCEVGSIGHIPAAGCASLSVTRGTVPPERALAASVSAIEGTYPTPMGYRGCFVATVPALGGSEREAPLVAAVCGVTPAAAELAGKDFEVAASSASAPDGAMASDVLA
eukprot:6207543-Pleurochrysis_carterae.AAC.1